MSRMPKIAEKLGFWKRRLVIKADANQAKPAPVDVLLARARNISLQSPGTPASDTLLDLCAAIETMQASQTDLRREAFREAVRGIANVIRNQQLPPSSPLSHMVPGGYGSPEQLAGEIEQLNANEPVSIAELRQLRQKLKAASEGSDELDDALKRLYYAKVVEGDFSTENLLPPGSPSRSLELAVLIVEKILPNGWWTMGSNGVNLTEPPVAKVGTWTGDEPKAESAATAPLALLSAFVLTLIETAKRSEQGR